MYDLISGLINHTYSSNYSGEQQYIYYICGAVICIVLVVLVDLIYRFIHKIIH